MSDSCFVARRAAAATIIAAALFAANEASAHCIIGSRFLPATISSEDPCVADELSLPTVSWFRTPATEDEPSTRVTTISFEFAKRITPDFGISIGRSYLILKPDGLPKVHGWDNVEVGLKYQLFTDPAREFIVSFGLDIDIGGTGSDAIGAEKFSTYTPQFYFGKGFGDLPDSAKFLRPLAITGVIGYSIPSRASQLTDMGDIEVNPHFLKTGFSFQYSLPYLQANVQDTGFGMIANHLIPLVEIALSTPLDGPDSGLTTGTINPGFLWVDKYYQLGFELLIPINGRTGNHVGFLAQLHFYLDDIAPNTIGRPLFGARR
jgi:hypothetical protein